LLNKLGVQDADLNGVIPRKDLEEMTPTAQKLCEKNLTTTLWGKKKT